MKRPGMIDLEQAGQILERARKVAVDYYELTGKPLGITGEYGEYVAARTLGLTFADARSPGFDAVDMDDRKIQIKARSIPRHKKLGGQRLGSIRLDHEWDCVVLVLLDERFEPQAIYEADRAPLEEALSKPGSKARNERGVLAVSKFIALGRRLWPDEQLLRETD